MPACLPFLASSTFASASSSRTRVETSVDTTFYQFSDAGLRRCPGLADHVGGRHSAHAPSLGPDALSLVVHEELDLTFRENSPDITA